MKIAAIYENGMIAPDFETASQCKVYTIENDKLSGSEILDFGDCAHDEFLEKAGVGILVCHKISVKNKSALTAAGIAVFSGMSGDADMQVGILLMGMLGIQDTSVSAALHSCGDASCSGDCSACHSAKNK